MPVRLSGDDLAMLRDDAEYDLDLSELWRAMYRTTPL